MLTLTPPFLGHGGDLVGTKSAGKGFWVGPGTQWCPRLSRVLRMPPFADTRTEFLESAVDSALLLLGSSTPPGSSSLTRLFPLPRGKSSRPLSRSTPYTSTPSSVVFRNIVAVPSGLLRWISSVVRTGSHGWAPSEPSGARYSVC